MSYVGSIHLFCKDLNFDVIDNEDKIILSFEILNDESVTHIDISIDKQNYPILAYIADRCESTLKRI